jgi:hypothetical protein
MSSYLTRKLRAASDILLEVIKIAYSTEQIMVRKYLTKLTCRTTKLRLDLMAGASRSYRQIEDSYTGTV